MYGQPYREFESLLLRQEKPIEINLNINVKQEVVVRLQKDADDFIANNPELFPK